MPTRPIFRFAPSPNGALHLGHAYSALLNQRLAARAGGRLLVRLEDIDRARCSRALADQILADLAWIGVRWENPVRVQSEHFPDYAAAILRLEARGLAYPCFCTRGAITRRVRDDPGWPHDPDGSPLYPGICRALPAAERDRRMGAGEPFAIRLDMAAALAAVPGPLAWSEFFETDQPRPMPADAAVWGDVVLRRKDVPACYHVAVVVDDALQDVSDVVRGADLQPATGLHRLLQHLLDLPAPTYHHHRLIRDPAGEKLSKSRGSASLADLRRSGLSPADVVTLLERDGLPQQ